MKEKSSKNFRNISNPNALRKISHESTHKVFSYFFILLITTGIGNYIFGGTILAGWKQFIVIIGYLLCLFLVKSTAELRRILLATILLQATWVLTSFIAGLDAEVVFYNLFYYSGWIPFFMWAARGGADYYLERYGKFTFYLVIICGVGLIIDSNTDMFLFLASRQMELDVDYFLLHSEVAKRSAFIFTTSTLVMPVLGGMIVVSLLSNPSPFRLAICAVIIFIAILTSATANSVVIGSGILLGMLMHLGIKPLRIVSATIVFSLVIYFVLPMLGDENFITKQIESIASRQSFDSEGNLGRLWYWGNALDHIYKFSILEHIIGSGLGTTNSNNGNQMILHTHGESSFFQAYLEGGLVGLTMRLMPFLLIATLVKFSDPNNRPYVIIGYVVPIFLIDSIAPIFGNIASQAILGFLMGKLYLGKTSFSRPTQRQTK